MTTYSRKVSANERLWIIANMVRPPFVNQFFLEGKGGLNPEKALKALDMSAQANPGSRARLKGFLGTCRWVDSGIRPRYRVMDGSKWSGFDLENAPFINDALSPYEEGVEFLLLTGDPFRFGFRANHCLMDGRGMIGYALDLLQHLCDRPMVGSDSTLTDFELAKRIKKNEGPFPLGNAISPLGPPTNEKGIDWRRIQLKGQYSNILAQIALNIGRQAWKHEEGRVLIGIPVDLRIRDHRIRSTANLSLPVFIEVTPKSTQQSISEDIASKLKTMQECNYNPAYNFMKYIPLWMMARMTETIMQKTLKQNRYLYSAIITNMNRIPLEIFQFEGFTPTAGFGIAPIAESLPVFVGTGGYGDTVELTSTVPKAFGSNGRIDKFMESFRENLIPKK